LTYYTCVKGGSECIARTVFGFPERLRKLLGGLLFRLHGLPLVVVVAAVAVVVVVLLNWNLNTFGHLLEEFFQTPTHSQTQE